MKITFSNSVSGLKTDTLIVPVFEGSEIPDGLSVSVKKFVTKILNHEKQFSGRTGQTMTLRGGSRKMILLGLGKKDALSEKNIRQAADPLRCAMAAEGMKKAVLSAGDTDAALAAHLADALLHGSYEFKKYKTTKPAAAEMEIDIHTPSSKQAEKKFGALRQTTESVFWASDLANEPGNILNPETYAEKIKQELSPLGIKITVLDQKEMEKLGMGAALAVGRGSATPPCMVVMEYNGSGNTAKQPLALVGKGLTFDAGGISLKPGAGMGDMTLDMGGSAAVVGAMRSLACRKSTAKVVAIVGLVENMPDGKAYRPGDILTSMNGKTIYVGNTDAEGRLVLADAMTYIQRTYDPHTVIDLATLTGAAVAALGPEFAAVFTNDKSLSGKFNKASAASGEKIWEMPLMETESFTKAVRSTPFADLTNMAAGPGACTAAAFLQEFIEDAKDGSARSWMHIDMAGPGIPGSVMKGWGVRLLDQFVRDHFEKAPAAAEKKANAPKPPGA